MTHPPQIIKKPQNQGVRVGGVAVFYCRSSGNPPPTIVWRKNTKKISSTQSRYTIIDNGGESILRIEPVRAGRDDAPYECVAENGVGDAVSAEATLTVYEGKCRGKSVVITSKMYIIQKKYSHLSKVNGSTENFEFWQWHTYMYISKFQNIVAINLYMGQVDYGQNWSAVEFVMT
ncbi:unnamed protein product [Hermetia illucens]|uniref:Ig-like domain-containing protein n=1 Tax=Hermetia illucens TaxID=343691 RepID=A0A7R8YVM3_HERIL|nr:unnamed protein product [Hermetia illucens]